MKAELDRFLRVQGFYLLRARRPTRRVGDRAPAPQAPRQLPARPVPDAAGRFTWVELVALELWRQEEAARG